MHIRLLSDIHLELNRKGPRLVHGLIDKISQSSSELDSETSWIDDVLILSGDIGNPAKPSYRSFLSTISPLFKQIFIIAGNHEYYQKESWPDRTRLSMDEVDSLIDEITSSISNIHFLNRSSFIYGQVRFLGCTLWTPSNPDLYRYINDYHQIPAMTLDRRDELHQRDLDWLTQQLNLSDPVQYDKTVVITHHLPSYELVGEKFKLNPLNCFYANQLDDLVKKADIWCCGHTHVSSQREIGNCKCYVNPVGYINEITGWDPNLRIQLN